MQISVYVYSKLIWHNGAAIEIFREKFCGPFRVRLGFKASELFYNSLAGVGSLRRLIFGANELVLKERLWKCSLP